MESSSGSAVPKLLQWKHSLSQHYVCAESILITSGCSFTASTLQLKTAASWPGYVVDRCRFDYCLDYSYPAAGNEYIANSILHHFSTVDDTDIKKYKVMIMWSGIDRQEEKISGSTQQPTINNVAYLRTKLENINRIESTQQSVRKILEVYNYLTSRGISFLFTFYSNLLFPPYIPKRDTTHHFEDYLDPAALNSLREIPWIPTDPMNYLYEYAFVNDFLTQGDHFHPPANCTLQWVDQVLLPELAGAGKLKPVDQ
jgi:hypothetical protein